MKFSLRTVYFQRAETKRSQRNIFLFTHQQRWIIKHEGSQRQYTTFWKKLLQTEGRIRNG